MKEKQELDVNLKSSLIPLTTIMLSTYSWSETSSLDKNFQGYIGAFSNQLGGTIGDVPGNRYGSEFYFNYHDNKPGKIEKKFTLNAAVNDQNLSMYSLNEGYASKQMGSFRLTLGRQILPWSKVDSFWGFGKLNNRQNFNGFTPGQEGLTGGNLNFRLNNGFKFNFFASGIYVPEMNPSLEIDKSSGTITSKHPWAEPPAPTADPGGGEVPIFYTVNYPSINDVVWRYSTGFQFGWDTKHFSWDAFYMRKPENSPSTTVEVSYNTGDQIINVEVDPQFYYHDLYGGNLSYQNNNYKLYASAIAVRPNANPDTSLQAYTYTQIETIKRREDYLGFGGELAGSNWDLGINYVARVSPFDRSGDIQAQDPRWNQAVNLYFNILYKKLFKVFYDIKYDMLTTDRLMMLGAQYFMNQSFSFNAGVNMIGGPVNGKSYWSKFKNNDAIYAGARYSF